MHWEGPQKLGLASVLYTATAALNMNIKADINFTLLSFLDLKLFSLQLCCTCSSICNAQFLISKTIVYYTATKSNFKVILFFNIA